MDPLSVSLVVQVKIEFIVKLQWLASRAYAPDICQGHYGPFLLRYSQLLRIKPPYTVMTCQGQNNHVAGTQKMPSLKATCLNHASLKSVPQP